MSELNEGLLNEIVEAVKELVKKEQSDRLRDIYLVGDIEKDTARQAIERLRELASESRKPITIYINSAGGNVTDGLALHDSVRYLVSLGYEVTIVVQGMAVFDGLGRAPAASPGKRFGLSAFVDDDPPSPRNGPGGSPPPRRAQHLDRLKQMQSQIYRILADRSGKPLRQIIRDTKRTDFYLDALRARDYGLIDEVLGRLMPSSRTSPRPHRHRSGARSLPAVDHDQREGNRGGADIWDSSGTRAIGGASTAPIQRITSAAVPRVDFIVDGGATSTSSPARDGTLSAPPQR